MGQTLSWKTVFRQTDWSVGYCTHCDRFEAIRVGDAVRVVSIYGAPILRSVIGEGSCCDWCEYSAGPYPEARLIPLGEWSSSQGIRSLFEKCAPELQPEVPQLTSDSDIHNLLTWVRKQSSIDAVDIGVGLITGLLIGAALALSVGLYLANQEGYDPIKAGLLSFVAGAVPGSIIGSLVEAVLKGRKVARKMITAAYHKYLLDPEKLAALAQSYQHRIRSAVRYASGHDLS